MIVCAKRTNQIRPDGRDPGFWVSLLLCKYLVRRFFSFAWNDNLLVVKFYF